MLQKRVIPTLLLRNTSLVKTINFDKFEYIGDPANTVRIFNELEVDELCFLDITATVENREPNYKVLQEISEESFMPLSYGGGIADFNQAKRILGMGFEKVIINSSALKYKNLIPEISSYFGTQSIIGSIDVKSNWLGVKSVYTKSGSEKLNLSYLEVAKKMEILGVGEILVTSVDRDGTWEGYDIDIVREVTDLVSVPVIANGGCGTINHIEEVLNKGGAQAAAVGSMVVFQKKGMGVLVNFPDRKILDKITIQ